MGIHMFYRFDVRQPLTLKEASETLYEIGEGALPLAGGTDLMIMIRERKVKPRVLVDLWRLRPELSYVKRGGGVVRIGALTTVEEICSAPELKDVRYAGFAGLCHWFATPYIRSMATIGGNLGVCHSFSDFIPLTLVLDAEVVLHGVKGERTVPVRGLSSHLVIQVFHL
jgi:CO/xanthine dehydrogenase FAD-binding subunit